MQSCIPRTCFGIPSSRPNIPTNKTIAIAVKTKIERHSLKRRNHIKTRQCFNVFKSSQSPGSIHSSKLYTNLTGGRISIAVLTFVCLYLKTVMLVIT